MRNLKLDRAVYLLLAVSAALSILIYRFQAPATLDASTLFGIFSKVVTIDTLLVTLFIKYLWKFRLFRGWLVLIPNLTGTWKGEIRSTWQDPNTEKRFDPIPALLTIKQSLFYLSCVMRTEEMTSSSFSAGFVLDEDNQKSEICYSYNSLPNQVIIERSPQHLGTALLEIDENPKKTLCGHYWSGRKTTGDLEFDFWKKERLKCFPDNLRRKHPVSLSRNYKD